METKAAFWLLNQVANICFGLKLNSMRICEIAKLFFESLTNQSAKTPDY